MTHSRPIFSPETSKTNLRRDPTSDLGRSDLDARYVVVFHRPNGTQYIGKAHTHRLVALRAADLHLRQFDQDRKVGLLVVRKRAYVHTRSIWS